MNKPNRNPHTLTRWILTEQQKYPGAKGDLSIILNSITLAIKIIAGSAKGAGIFHRINHVLEEQAENEILASTNASAAPEDEAKDEAKASDADSMSKSQSILDKSHRIDVYAEEVLKNCIGWCQKVGMIASQRTSEPILFSNAEDPKYALVFDPLDGARNIEANVSVGTIFGIVRIQDPQKPSDRDVLQPGKDLVCAGYALYGDATIVVMTFGEEVNGFTLDPTIGEFVMTHKNIRIPRKGKIYSVNEGNFEEWEEGVQQYVTQCKTSTKERPSMKLRYIGSMVADVHRTLLYGGIFMYPKSKRFPDGKLGLLYEVNPLCYVIETAGGKATDGTQSPLTVAPKGIHQRSAVFLGSVDDVTALEKCLQK